MSIKFLHTCTFFLFIALFLVSCEGDSRSTESGETILNPVQPVIITSSPTHAIGGSSEQKLGQTFTINYDATLTGVFLPLDCSSGELSVEIRNLDGSMPGATVISSNAFPADSLVTGVSVFKLFSLPASAVSSGDQLALVLSNETGTCGMSSGPIGDPYTFGEGFYDARPNAPGWVRFADFDSTAGDLAFQVLLEGVR